MYISIARRDYDVMESAVSSITGSSSNEAEVTARIPIKVCYDSISKQDTAEV